MMSRGLLTHCFSKREEQELVFWSQGYQRDEPVCQAFLVENEWEPFRNPRTSECYRNNSKYVLEKPCSMSHGYLKSCLLVISTSSIDCGCQADPKAQRIQSRSNARFSWNTLDRGGCQFSKDPDETEEVVQPFHSARGIERGVEHRRAALS